MLFIKRLYLIDRAEDPAQWESRARHQWGLDTPIAVRVTSTSGTVLGSTFPRKMQFSTARSSWEAQWSLQAPGADVSTPNAAAPPEGNASTSSAPEIPAPNFPIDISSCVKGNDCVFILEIFSVTGEVKAAAVVDCGAAVGRSTVLHRVARILPATSEVPPEDSILGALEYAVMPHEMYAAVPEDEKPPSVAFDPADEIPLPYPEGEEEESCVRYSTKLFYYPTSMVTGAGDYIVSNVLCVESNSDHQVSVELLVGGGHERASLLSVSPESEVVLASRGQRAYFACTWNLFKPYVSGVKLYMILQENGAMRLPQAIKISGASPCMEEDAPFLFWANMSQVTNGPCSQEELRKLRVALPIFNLSNKVKKSDEDKAAAAAAAAAQEAEKEKKPLTVEKQEPEHEEQPVLPERREEERPVVEQTRPVEEEEEQQPPVEETPAEEPPQPVEEPPVQEVPPVQEERRVEVKEESTVEVEDVKNQGAGALY